MDNFYRRSLKVAPTSSTPLSFAALLGISVCKLSAWLPVNTTKTSSPSLAMWGWKTNKQKKTFWNYEGIFFAATEFPDNVESTLLFNLYAGQEATVRTGHGTTDWFQIGKRMCQGCILSHCLFNFYEEYIMHNAGWMKHKLKSRLPGETSITSDTQMIPPLWQKAKRS